MLEFLSPKAMTNNEQHVTLKNNKYKHMKSLFLSMFIVLFVSCNSDDSIPKDYTAENEQEIVDYIAEHNLNATATGSGLYYVIDEVGTGADITATSDVSLRYKGTFTDGGVFDEQTEGVSFNLQGVIPGFAEGVQYFNEGGSGLLLIPAHLGYGNQSSGSIPAGSVLIFEIELIDYEVENEQEIVDYIAENNLTATRSDSGLYYVINEEGTGENPTEESNVTVAYKGYLTDGDVFDESTVSGVSFNLNQVIPGWTEGIQYFKVGGNGQLLIPSHLAYGKYGNQSIPGGAVLIFDVDLKSIN